MAVVHSRRGAGALIALGCLLLTAALALGGYNLWDDHRAGLATARVLAQMTLPEPIPDYLLDPDMEMPTQEIGGYLYIGKLSIPALALELPVLDRWDYKRMKLAPCRYTGTAYRPGFVLCAHNYTAHFGRLKNLTPGDQIHFTDVNGNEFIYKVATVETLPPTAVTEMKSTDWDLTLFSCTLSGRARITIRCKK